MVVVLVVFTRAATPAVAAGVLFRGNGRAENMGKIVADQGLAASYTAGLDRVHWPVQAEASAWTTASPICAVPTLVVPAL
jgi:hypothetical protein